MRPKMKRSIVQNQQIATFDLFRLTHSKREVDISTTCLRGYIKLGLPVYKMGKAAFVSRSQLAQWIITQSNRVASYPMNPEKEKVSTPC